MIVLGIDTTSVYCSVSVLKDGAEISGKVLNNGNTHSEVLLPLIKECLEDAKLGVKDVDLFAISSCPGSFTGVRIGASTVKGLAFGSGKPCVGVSTLEALAYNMRDTNGILAPVMDARRNQFYNGLFRCKNGCIERLTPDRLISAADLEREFMEFSGEDIYFIGDGYELAKSKIKAENIRQTPKDKIPQNGASVATLALSVYERCKDTEDFSDIALKPGYLRASQAEREKAEKENGAK